MSILFGIVLSGFVYFQNKCDADGEHICYVNREDVFKIEEDASLKVQVETEALGEYLVNTWDKLHPKHKGSIEYVVKSPLSLAELLDDLETDIVVTSIHYGAFVLDKMRDMGDVYKKEVLVKSPKRMQGAINLNGSYFTPNSVSGWTFVYNKTLAESLDLDLTDSDGNGLPDDFDSFEKIFELDVDVKYKFPITFVDQYSFYPFLTSGKWELNFTNEGMDPGFKHPEFLKGLDLIVDFRKLDMGSSDELTWKYDRALENGETLFSMVSDFMVPHLELDDEIVYAPFPTYHENPLTPLGFVDGYMVSEEVMYPSAAAEVLRILRDAKAAQVYKSDKTFVYHKKFVDDLKVDDVILQKILAYNYTTVDPVIVLEDYPQIMARDVFYEADFMPVLKDLYDNKITQEEAQKQFIESYNKWLEERVDKLNVEKTN